MSRFTQANQVGWDGLAAAHFRNYHTEKLLAGTPLLHDVIQEEVGDVSGKSLIHLLCHIGTDTLSWALLGAKVTGVDISPESLKYARRLAGQMGCDARFILSDIMEFADQARPEHDIVFSSTGVLCWIPDIDRYANTVRRLLKDDGIFYIHDGHPFRTALTDDYGPEADYFRKERWEFANLGDYTDPDLKVPSPSYEWQWTMGDIVTAFCDVGMRIEFLHEFPKYLYAGYTPYDVDEEKIDTFPCTFSLKAVAR